MGHCVARPLGALLGAGLMAAGCFTAGVESPAARQGPRGSDVGVSWFWGLGGTVHYAQECHAGLAEVETHLPWYAYLVSPLTVGIATPLVADYTCARGS